MRIARDYGVDAFAVGLLCVFISILFWKLHYYPEIGYDESASFLGLQLLKGEYGNTIDPLGPGWTRYFAMDVYPPVYFLAQAAIFKLAGFGIIQARLASLVFVMLTACTVYGIARRASGPPAALVALAVYLYVPARIYTLVARPDIAVPVFLVLSAALLLAGRQREAPWLWLLSGAACAAAVLSHFVALMAGPAFAVMIPVLLGRSFWRSRSFHLFVAGALLPVLAYLAFIHPHSEAVLRQLVRYRTVGEVGGGMAQRWPLVHVIAHWRIVVAYHPVILWLMAASGIATILCAFRKSRALLSEETRFFNAFFVLTVVMISLYPNIKTFQYYAPAYYVFAAPAIGFLAADIARGAKAARWALTLAAGALALVLVHRAYTTAASQVARARNIPVTVAPSWLANFPRRITDPTLGTTHWLFSPIGERILASTVLELDPGGGTARVAPALVRIDPRSRAGLAGRSFIADKYAESYLLGGLKAMTPMLAFVAAGLRPVATVLDLRVSTSATLYAARRANGPGGPWPRVGRPGENGVTEVRPVAGCAATVAFAAPVALEPLSGPVVYQTFRLARKSFVAADDVYGVRVGIAWDAGARGPVRAGGVLLAGDDRTQDKIRALASAGRDLTGLIGHVDEGYGVIVDDGDGRASGSAVVWLGPADDVFVTVFANAPGRIERIEAVRFAPGGGRCDAAERRLRNGLADDLRHPLEAKARVLPIPATVSAARPLVVGLTSKVHRILVRLWQSGRVVGTFEAHDAARLPVRFPAPGRYGVEVWLYHVPGAKPNVSAHFLTAE